MTAAQTAAAKALEAATSATTATNKATEATTAATTAATKATEASTSASNAATSASTAGSKASEASASATTASTKASEAAQSATSANTAKTDAVAAKTAAETAQAAAETAQSAAETAAATFETDTTLTVSGKAADAKAVGDEISDLKEDLSALNIKVDDIIETEGLKKYGVSGVGQSASALTRIWDSVGMTAQVGTDGDNSNVVNNFDNVTPFNRRKCVGHWVLHDGRPQFVVEAYLGDEDYAEDGTKGDYVAVECPRAYYYNKDGILGVSAHHYPGWKPFDIFCHTTTKRKRSNLHISRLIILLLKMGMEFRSPILTTHRVVIKHCLMLRELITMPM